MANGGTWNKEREILTLAIPKMLTQLDITTNRASNFEFMNIFNIK